MIIPREIVEQLNELPIEDVAERVGLVVKKHKARCFMHDDHHPSLSFNTKKNTFFCFVCNKGGGPIRLVQEYNKFSFQEACVRLGREFRVWWPEGEIRIKAAKELVRKVHLKPVEEITPFDEELSAWLIHKAGLSESAKRFLYNERRFEQSVIERLNIKSVTYPKRVVDALVGQFGEERCLRSGLVKHGNYGLYFYFYTPCLLFPYYGQDGRLIGIQSRYIGDKENAPRFQFQSSQKTRLFNLPMLNGMKSGDILYISEGITDCLALLSAGKKAVAIPSATILPEGDLILLKDYDLHMFPDNDDAGRRAFRELRRFFVNNYSTLKEERLPEGIKDYCMYYVKQKANEAEIQP
jgi:DNA primase